MNRHESHSGDGLDLDAAHELLSDSRRRVALRYLARIGGPVEIETLATHVAVEESAGNGVGNGVGDDRERRVSISLHHCHLPKLAAVGVVDYDPDRNTVLYREISLLERLLDADGT